MKPNTFAVHCIRCDKLTAGEHPCTPTKQYRAGMIEGIRIAREEMQTDIAENGRHYNVKAVITYFASVDKRIGRLIKQYSGE